VHDANLQDGGDRRDGYVRRRLLAVEGFPTVEFAPTSVRGLPFEPAAGPGAASAVSFEVIGNLTVRGVTRSATWVVTARRAGDRLTGTASTRFTFTDFAIAQPRVPVVLSVADTITLEYDFALTRSDEAPR
jgi:polyisoprenoid-binding protein YceI